MNDTRELERALNAPTRETQLAAREAVRKWHAAQMLPLGESALRHVFPLPPRMEVNAKRGERNQYRFVDGRLQVRVDGTGGWSSYSAADSAAIAAVCTQPMIEVEDDE